MNANSSIFTPAFCYGAAIFAAFVTALSQIILKKQANITEAKKSGFFSKFLNPRVIIYHGRPDLKGKGIPPQGAGRCRHHSRRHHLQALSLRAHLYYF